MEGIQNTLVGQNITLIYQTLDYQKVDINQLRNLLDFGNEQMIFKRDGILITYPPKGILIQIMQDRMLVTCQQRSDKIGDVPIWEIASYCYQLANGAPLAAYGFNYDLEIVLPQGNIYQILNQVLSPDTSKLEKAVKGSTLALTFTAGVTFQHEQKPYSLLIQPQDEKRLRLNLNAHFEKSKSLPSDTLLEKDYREEYNYLLTIIPGILAEGFGHIAT